MVLDSNKVAVPSAVDAERAFLGSLLLAPKKVPEFMDKITSEDFFLNRHGWIWESMLLLHKEEQSIDYLTVINNLREQGRDNETGGAPYLIGMVNEVPSSVHADDYCEIIIRASLRRKLLISSDEIREIVLDPTTSLPDAVSTIQDNLVGVVGSIDGTINKTELVSLDDAVSNFYDRLDSLVSEPDSLTGVKTGFSDIDALLSGIERSNLVIFAGRPGMGKTSWLLSSMLNMARNGNVCIFFTMEMSIEEIVRRIISIVSGVQQQKLRRGQVTKADMQQIMAAIQWLSGVKIYLDDTSSMTPNMIHARCANLKRRNGLDVVFVDYLQLMSGDDRYRNNRVQETSYISRRLKEIAGDLDIVLISAAQLNRNVEYREDRHPKLADLRDSGSIEQDADCVIFIHREGDSNLAEIIVSKNRHGAIGNVNLIFEGALTRFRDSTMRY